MESFTSQFLQSLAERLPTLLGAAGILILGWLAALVVAEPSFGCLERGTDIQASPGIHSSAGLWACKSFALTP